MAREILRPRTDAERAEVKAAQSEAYEEAKQELQTHRADEHSESSWDTAFKTVREFKPVPWIMWPVIHHVFGQYDVAETEYIVFDLVEPLIVQACKNPALAPGLHADERIDKMSLADAVSIIGGDVAAALVVLHSVCRKVSKKLPERLWRPIIDDALLRAHIGYYVGSYATELGRGRGMLAGFASRAGLAVQVAAGAPDRAALAFECLAKGMTLKDLGNNLYGCDPLQIAAMTLSAAGCNTEAAFGIVAFNYPEVGIKPGTRAHLWLSAFAVTEHLRAGNFDRILPEHWTGLGFKPEQRAALSQLVQRLQRKGHGWWWITQSLIPDEGE